MMCKRCGKDEVREVHTYDGKRKLICYYCGYGCDSVMFTERKEDESRLHSDKPSPVQNR